MRIAYQQRLRKSLIERTKGRNRLRQAAALLIRRGQIVSDVVANVPCVRLGPAKWINCLGRVVIKKTCIADGKPRQRTGILCTVLPGKCLDSRIGLRSTVLQKLLRHRLQRGRGNKGLMNSPEPGRIASRR